jgi:hypothetical protein
MAIFSAFDSAFDIASIGWLNGQKDIAENTQSASTPTTIQRKSFVGVPDYTLVFPRFSGHPEEFQLLKKRKMGVCHGCK